MSILSFSEPANSYLELTGLFPGNTVIKVFGYMGALCLCLSQFWLFSLRSIQCLKNPAQNLKLYKDEGTEFVGGSALPAWQPAEPEHPDTAPCAVIGSSWAGDAPTHSLGCVGHVCCSRSPASTTLRGWLCSPASCQSRCTLLMKVFRRVWFYLCLSSKHSAVKKDPCIRGLGCLTLGLSFKFKLLWLIPLIYYFQCKKCKSQQQQRVKEGLWVLLSWTLLPPEVTVMSRIFLIYFLDNLHLLVGGLVGWAAPRAQTHGPPPSTWGGGSSQRKCPALSKRDSRMYWGLESHPFPPEVHSISAQ